jgi:peptide/nickel transport system permease protein
VRSRRRGAPPAQTFYATSHRELLDLMLARQVAMRETGYSEPLAYLGLTKEPLEVDGKPRDFPRLQFGGAHLADPATQWAGDVALRALGGAVGGLVVAALIALRLLLAARTAASAALRDIAADRTDLPLRAALLTVRPCACWRRGGRADGPLPRVRHRPHRQRRALPGAEERAHRLRDRHAGHRGHAALRRVLGVLAGYFKRLGRRGHPVPLHVLSSVPNVLLIAACVLMVQVFLDKNPDLFETGRSAPT